MSVGGYFVLELRCDGKPSCDRNEDFVYPTRYAAKEAARSAGWKIPREGRVLCPEHREKEAK